LEFPRGFLFDAFVKKFSSPFDILIASGAAEGG